MGAFDWFWKALGAQSERNDRKSRQTVSVADDRVAELERLSDTELVAAARAITRDGEISDRSEFLAILQVAASRTLDMRPFSVQSQAVLRMLEGDVIQMATGEGKTLVGAMTATGFALTGRRVHAITVNDYLARRDAEWMRPLVEFFGLTVSAVTEKLSADERRKAYRADVVYAPVNELGFDLLRDNQVTDRAQMVRTPADVALIDEADSVLVDEALVPLVLAGSVAGEQTTGEITAAVSGLREHEHYTIDDDHRNVFLTDAGAHRLERELGIDSLYADEHIGTTLVRVNLALHAKALLIRDIHYLVEDGKVALIDASRGRVADLQRWPDGLQAAVEAKEGLTVTDGGRILDQITLQALMGRYPQLCGMTGTAVEAVDQLREFYDLRVSVIERNRPLQRIDEDDRVYARLEDKNAALVERIAEIHATGQPILVGTHDVAESEFLAEELGKRGIELNVLNAKNDEEEAGIIAEAGERGRVTVSTQMAGRGTDIRLGEGVAELGGLAVIGTSRHRTSRLDNQLRGRAGRQGDPGMSVFYLSLEDDLIETGGADTAVSAQPDGDGLLDNRKVRDFVNHCQRVTENQLLTIHSQTWKYNRLLADQRKIIDTRRDDLLDTDKAVAELRERAPERAEELADVDAQVLEQAAREIMLFHLDDEWAEHLATMDDVRESIHLRAVAKETPIDEFHRIAVREFKDLAQRAVDKSVETFRTARIDAEGVHLGDDGLARPSATWTYMVSDNPLAGGGSGALATMERFFS
ncbi:accessory Sec system translocase SecA2 [Corynebacterium yudongzhengii]|uniref:Protein translocase subunit SecA n=1 Tax=Corynebacterium yudongzhengii TaxID=2080740 RepID=A0A2U1T8L9_9CORY|nr:accessory Sec system translocase SecA2 [Corynebacterium yudongzhengii]AWB81937.1 accessory Sec system translocase SecA2 [Corynebacterium yudongzhengii]PWC02329.1 accessory Sec system translocase SecA2 [Corynebacterium yudongzhengii]